MGLHESLLNVQTSLRVPKGQYNGFGKYNYRSAEDILEAVKPLLKANKLSLTISDEVVHVGDRYYIKSTATVTDIVNGESISSTAYAREDENRKGMDLSQVSGSTASYSKKYVLGNIFCVDDCKDADTGLHPVENKIDSLQVAEMNQIRKDKYLTKEQVKDTCIQTTGKDDFRLLTYDDAINLITALKKMPANPAPPSLDQTA